MRKLLGRDYTRLRCCLRVHCHVLLQKMAILGGRAAVNPIPGK